MMIDMHGCKETVRRWPDTFDEVSPDELGDFIAHAEGCAYHTATLRAAEEEVFPRARAARALSGDGSILVGEKSDRAVAENRRLMERWSEVAAKRELPFCRIALRHDGHDIARCDNFLDLSKHDAVHELDAGIRLEVWGIITGDGVRVEARLGTYDLGRDPSKGEKFYEVGNGYEVGLSVWEVGVEVFKVQFRCVESEKLARAQTGERKSQAAAASGGTALVSDDAASDRERHSARANAEPKHRLPRVWPSLPASWRLSAQFALGVLLAVAAVTIANAVGSAAVGKRQRAEAVEGFRQVDEAMRLLQAEDAERRRQVEDARRRLRDDIKKLSAMLRKVGQTRPGMRVQDTSGSAEKGAATAVALREQPKDYNKGEVRALRVNPHIPVSAPTTPAIRERRVNSQPQRDAKVGQPKEQPARPRTAEASSGGRAKGMA